MESLWHTMVLLRNVSVDIDILLCNYCNLQFLCSQENELGKVKAVQSALCLMAVTMLPENCVSL